MSHNDQSNAENCMVYVHTCGVTTLYAHLALAGQSAEGGAGWRPLVCTTRRPMIGIDVLIAPYPRHAPYGTVGSPQYKDGTSMAAPDPENASRRGSGSRPVRGGT